jgi:tRNA G26 N,N-dimethylase Trm1
VNECHANKNVQKTTIKSIFYYHPKLATPRNCNIVIINCMKKTRKNIIKLDALSSLD